MGKVEDTLIQLAELSEKLKGQQINGNLILVDLANSTSFKTHHPESVWLDRLVAFYETVKSNLPDGQIKYLGDGVLAFFEADKISSGELLEKAKDILIAINELNSTNSFPGDSALVVRIILNSGDVYMFNESDPQGTAVDKLFRMEKFVPDSHIGMTEEFILKAKLNHLEPVGQFFLKGLAKGKHSLYLNTSINPTESTATLKTLMAESASANIWWLPGTSDQLVYLVDGYIPPDKNSLAVIQISDKGAVLEALCNLALAGGIQNVKHHISPQFPDEEIHRNIVCIGGPYYNSITNRLMKDANLPVYFEGLELDDDETPLVNSETGQKFEKLDDDMDRLIKDWGLFARFTNPYDEKSTIIIACGIESPSVEGIVRVFSPRTNPFFQKLYDHISYESSQLGGNETLKEFCCVMPFNIEVATGSARLPSFEDQIKYIFWEK